MITNDGYEESITIDKVIADDGWNVHFFWLALTSFGREQPTTEEVKVQKGNGEI